MHVEVEEISKDAQIEEVQSLSGRVTKVETQIKSMSSCSLRAAHIKIWQICIWTPFSIIHISMEIYFDKLTNGFSLTLKSILSQWEPSKPANV